MRSGAIYRWTLAAGLAAGLAACMGTWARAQNGDDAQAREKARQASCLTNMKQLSLGLMMYVQDYDTRLPPAGKWSKAILPYVKSDALYRCPSDGDKNSYAMNTNVGGRAQTTMKSPATLPMLFESNLHRPNAYGLAAAVAKPPRHQGGNNFAYADAHVKWESKTPGFGAPAPGGKAKKR